MCFVMIGNTGVGAASPQEQWDGAKLGYYDERFAGTSTSQETSDLGSPVAIITRFSQLSWDDAMRQSDMCRI